MREWNGRYQDDQRGLAWLLWQEGRVVNTVVELGIVGSLGVYRKGVTEGEHNK